MSQRNHAANSATAAAHRMKTRNVIACGLVDRAGIEPALCSIHLLHTHLASSHYLSMLFVCCWSASHCSAFGVICPVPSRPPPMVMVPSLCAGVVEYLTCPVPLPLSVVVSRGIYLAPRVALHSLVGLVTLLPCMPTFRFPRRLCAEGRSAYASPVGSHPDGRLIRQGAAAPVLPVRPLPLWPYIYKTLHVLVLLR